MDDRRYLIPFRASLLPQIFTDVLIIGSGVAGLRAAIAASAHSDVIVTSKDGLKQSNTFMAQGGIAAVLNQDKSRQPTGGSLCDSILADSFGHHTHDTLEVGAGLCDEPIVRQVVSAAPLRIKELIDWGMRFDRVGDDPASSFALGLEGGHVTERILHADGDATGKELVRTLAKQVVGRERIRVFDQCFVIDLITVDGHTTSRGGVPGHGDSESAESRCVGAITHHPQYGLQVIWAHTTILATGGCGQVYRESTNPTAATGDGLAAAYRAGARLADMAFIQFHPTTLYIAGAARSLISEAVRGEGARLVDRHGYSFMPDYDHRADLAPRDIVSQSILAQMAKTHFSHAYLDCRPIGNPRFSQRFPGIYALLQQFGLDPGKDPIPIHPAAHYMIGGVETDDHGRTNLTGLYACGEVSCTGIHGANRLASNSLLEGLVYGEVAGRVCQEMMEPTRSGSAAMGGPLKIVSDVQPSDRSHLDVADVRSSLRSVMWRHVGIERSGERLAEVQEMFEFWSRYTLHKIFDDRVGWEVQNMLLVGSLITKAAHWRQESRGTHYRVDKSKQATNFCCHDLWVKGESDPITRPVAPSCEPAIPRISVGAPAKTQGRERGR